MFVYLNLGFWARYNDVHCTLNVMNRHVSISSKALLKWCRYCFTYHICTIYTYFGLYVLCHGDNKRKKKYWLICFFSLVYFISVFCFAVILVVTVVVLHLFICCTKYKFGYQFCFALSSSIMWKSTFSSVSIESSELDFWKLWLLFIGAQWFDEFQPMTRCQFDFGSTPVANFKHAYDKRQISNTKSKSKTNPSNQPSNHSTSNNIENRQHFHNLLAAFYI